MTAYKLHDRLSYRVSRAARIMQSRLEARLADDGLTRMMWLVLTGLGEDGVRTPSQLADYIGITRPATSRLIHKMEIRGHIRRSGTDGDGRSVELSLTEEGRACLARARPQVDALLEHFTEKLSPEVYEAMMIGLASLAEGEGTELSRL